MYRVLVRKHKVEAIVRPPFEFLQHREKLKIKNGTRDKIHVSVPDVFEPVKIAKTRSGAMTVEPGKKLELTIRADAEDGAYSFQIFCEETHTYAQASSDPEFIVE